MSSNLLEKILDYTCKHWGISKWQLVGSKRDQKFVQARVTFALVARDYVKNKSKIARYIDKHPATFHNWEDMETNPDIRNAVREVGLKVDGVLDITKQIEKYFELKEKCINLRKDIESKQNDLKNCERQLEIAEQELKVEDLWETLT